MTEQKAKRGTSTPSFGSSKRESHDATSFYARFTPPEVSSDELLTRSDLRNSIVLDDARKLHEYLPENSVALVVTSPPYFAGKEYEETLGENGVPASYFEYLDLLRDVFASCQTALEPGGRIAVNVANLGRRPYRSLSSDVSTILADLGLLMRGEIVWWKGRAAGGSCAWGTFQRPGNPVLRDVTERIIVASKGRFDRAQSAKKRHRNGLPSTATISRDEFLEATTDLWELAPASATSVGHPAPFPVELPERLIELYTYEGDLVLDPFMGAGSTAMAAVRTGRDYVGFETDQAYIDLAEKRIGQETARSDEPERAVSVAVPAVASDELADPIDQAAREGRQAKYVAELVLRECGFTEIRSGVKVRGKGIELAFTAQDADGERWAFDVSGGFTTTRSGLKRSDTIWKTLATAAVYDQDPESGGRFIALTTEVPVGSTGPGSSLRAMTGEGRPIRDVIRLLDLEDRARLASYAAGTKGSS